MAIYLSRSSVPIEIGYKEQVQQRDRDLTGPGTAGDVPYRLSPHSQQISRSGRRQKLICRQKRSTGRDVWDQRAVMGWDFLYLAGFESRLWRCLSCIVLVTSVTFPGPS